MSTNKKFVQFAILTNGVICGIIYMSRGEAEGTRTQEPMAPTGGTVNTVEGFHLKKVANFFKNLLTNHKKCDIIYM